MRDSKEYYELVRFSYKALTEDIKIFSNELGRDRFENLDFSFSNINGLLFYKAYLQADRAVSSAEGLRDSIEADQKLKPLLKAHRRNRWIIQGISWTTWATLTFSPIAGIIIALR